MVSPAHVGTMRQSVCMPGYNVTVPARLLDDGEYARLLDMIEHTYGLAPINPGDTPRIYSIQGADGGQTVLRLAALLNRNHAAIWPNHIGQLTAEPA